MHYGAGLSVNVPMPEAEVAQAVDEVVKNTIIRGTKEYNKDEYVAGANEATSTRAFPAWTEGGKVFCLIEAPNADAAHTVHREAHGLLADEIYPVMQG